MSMNVALIWLKVERGACGKRQEEWRLFFLRGQDTEQFSLYP